MNRNVLVLSLAQIVAFCVSPALMFIGAIIGQQLAPSTELATLPIAAMVVGTALGAYPLISLMRNIGRKPIFVGSLLTIAVACLAIALALQLGNFLLFLISIFIIGACMAAIQQFRFAAMESVPSGRMATAASTVLLAGVAAAVVGPEMVFRGQYLFATEFAGSFILIALAYLACAALLLLYRQPRELNPDNLAAGGSARQLFGNPLFRTAVWGGASGFAIMTFVMTATPISMHDHVGHSLAETKWVIQSHVSAMFLPSLIVPFLIRRLGVQPVMVLGFCCYIATIVIGLANPGVSYYWFALIFLGVGWNFLFVGATTLLPETHPPAQHLVAQAVNDTVVFSLQALAALSSGVVLNLWGWHVVLLGCLPIILLQMAQQYRWSCQFKRQPAL